MHGGEVVDIKPATSADSGVLTREMALGGLEVARTLVAGYVEINRIRAEAAADVTRIEARTRAIEASMAAEVNRLVAERGVVESRGEVIIRLVGVITEQLRAVPVDDPAARRAVIDNLPRLAEMAFGLGNAPRG